METVSWLFDNMGALSRLDWLILISTLAFIVLYGVYKTRGKQTSEQYIKGGDCTLVDSRICLLWRPRQVRSPF